MITPEPPGLASVLICTVVFLRMSRIVSVVCAEVGMEVSVKISRLVQAIESLFISVFCMVFIYG
jgi:hypothetical protein